MSRLPRVSNAADRRQVRESEKKRRAALFQERDDLRTVMSTTGGRRWMWRLLMQCHFLESIVAPDPVIHQLAGERNIGCWVMDDILSACPERFESMFRENMTRAAGPERETADEEENGEAVE